MVMTTCDLHTVCELPSFARAAERAGMSEDEVSDLISFLAENPMAGEEIGGTGGCRKVRVAGRGKGKSGGYRTITFFSGEIMPIFLVTVFSKGQRSDLTEKECNELRQITKKIASNYRNRVADAGAVRGKTGRRA
jgi:hypothetical protein